MDKNTHNSLKEKKIAFHSSFLWEWIMTHPAYKNMLNVLTANDKQELKKKKKGVFAVLSLIVRRNMIVLLPGRPISVIIAHHFKTNLERKCYTGYAYFDTKMATSPFFFTKYKQETTRINCCLNLCVCQETGTSMSTVPQ